MDEKQIPPRKTIIIFCPFKLNNYKQCYLFGDLEFFESFVVVFFITSLCDTVNSKSFITLFNETKKDGDESIFLSKDWIQINVNKNLLTLKKFKINGDYVDVNSYRILWINYDFNLFSRCQSLYTNAHTFRNSENYINYFKEKINEKVNYEKQIIAKSVLFSFISKTVLKLEDYNLKRLPVTKYLNIALHIDNYLNGIIWAVKSVKRKNKVDIKVMNLIFSILLDMLLGILFLNWLNSKVSLDSSSSLFLYTAESIVNSIKDLIKWLRGDPAGLKLNWAFNKVLATFFSFHIDIWWTFLAYLQPVVKVIFQVFLKLGLLGITFQASITADLLALVSFHVYCIYAYAAKLYSIQISSMTSLWRLFLGRKKNPLRGKVDSCRYSPEQLFVGTLGFTVLLFLLPTTLLYYVVFTCIRLSILILQAVLLLLRYLNQATPVYSTILWAIRSPKVSVGVEIIPHNESLNSNLMLMTIKPMTYSWWETVCFFMPDCVTKLSGIDLSNLLSSLISGKLIYPI